MKIITLHFLYVSLHIRTAYAFEKYNFFHQDKKSCSFLNGEFTQKTSNLQLLLKDASNTQRYLQASLNKAFYGNQHFKVIIGNIKSTQSCQKTMNIRSISADYILDYARATVVARSLTYIPNAVNKIREHGLQIVDIKNFFFCDFEGGYKAVFLYIKDPSSQHIAEIQIITEAIEKVSRRTHYLFSQIRDIQNTASQAKRQLTIEEQDRINVYRKQQKSFFIDALK